MKDPPSQMQIPPNLVVAPVKLCMLSCPPVSQKCSNFWQRHHALDAHTPNFHVSAFVFLSIITATLFTFELPISRFPRFVSFQPETSGTLIVFFLTYMRGWLAGCLLKIQDFPLGKVILPQTVLWYKFWSTFFGGTQIALK